MQETDGDNAASQDRRYAGAWASGQLRCPLALAVPAGVGAPRRDLDPNPEHAGVETHAHLLVRTLRRLAHPQQR